MNYQPNKNWKEGSKYNIKNLLICKMENKALMAAFDYLNKNRVEVSALVFDGLMVYKHAYQTNECVTIG